MMALATAPVRITMAAARASRPEVGSSCMQAGRQSEHDNNNSSNAHLRSLDKLQPQPFPPVRGWTWCVRP